MTIQNFTILELATAVGGFGAAIALILQQVQRSRCVKCALCWGLVKCDRVLGPTPPKADNDLEVGVQVSQNVTQTGSTLNNEIIKSAAQIKPK